MITLHHNNINLNNAVIVSIIENWLSKGNAMLYYNYKLVSWLNLTNSYYGQQMLLAIFKFENKLNQ